MEVEPLPIPPNLERKEAPVFEKLVESGALPPLPERLPKNPAVVVPADRPGRYGGVWRRYAMGQDSNAMGRLIYEPALRWSGGGRRIEPNLCWKFEVSEDSRVFTFWMREGVRWSDGHPMTTEDVRFWWEDFFLNKDLNPVAPIWMQIRGELPDFQVLGPYKYRFVFPISYGLFLERAAWQGRMWMPMHYLEQFHVNYRNRDELESLAREAGFNSWHQLFMDKAMWRSNPEVPMINAWVIKNSWSSHHRIFERNPYYWKVDTEGRQLPYIDRVTHDNVQDRAALLFKLMSGDVLLQSRHVGFKDLPLFDDAIKKGRVRIIEWTESGNSGISILFNQELHGQGPVRRKSHAREEIPLGRLLRSPAPGDQRIVPLWAGNPGTSGANRTIPLLPIWAQICRNRHRIRPRKGQPVARRIGAGAQGSGGISPPPGRGTDCPYDRSRGFHGVDPDGRILLPSGASDQSGLRVF